MTSSPNENEVLYWIKVALALLVPSFIIYSFFTSESFDLHMLKLETERVMRCAQQVVGQAEGTTVWRVCKPGKNGDYESDFIYFTSQD